MYSRKAKQEAQERKRQNDLFTDVEPQSVEDLPAGIPHLAEGCLGFYDREMNAFIDPELWYRRNGRYEVVNE